MLTSASISVTSRHLGNDDRHTNQPTDRRTGGDHREVTFPIRETWGLENKIYTPFFMLLIITTINYKSRGYINENNDILKILPTRFLTILASYVVST